MKVVLDTNVLVAALVRDGISSTILRDAIEGKFLVITSEVLTGELIDILSRKFHFAPAQLCHLEQLLDRRFHKIFPSITSNDCRDEDDNRVLEAAVHGKCDYIVTGDQDLLILHPFRDIQIISPAEFGKILH